jgi:glycosyltransferase involved in cell wall biosynthesis
VIVDVVIPAFNEEGSIGKVVGDIRQQEVRHVVVVNNRSSDQTVEVARAAGAEVLTENRRGYGSACLKGIKWLNDLSTPPDVILFMDGDYSDYAEEFPLLVKPILDGKAEMVIGSRALGDREKGSMTPQQVFGNWLATRMIRLLFSAKFTDLGPYRTITRKALNQLGMRDPDYGWTVEMQVKAVQKGISYTEVPVNYRKRIGKSKVAGTLKGTILAGYKIITTIIKYS